MTATSHAVGDKCLENDRGILAIENEEFIWFGKITIRDC